MGIKRRATLVRGLLDALCIAGALIFCLGLGMAWRPLGVVALGALLATVGFLLGYDSRGKSE